MMMTEQNIKPIILSDELKAKLLKRANRIWNFSKVRVTYPHTRSLIQEELSTFSSINKIGGMIEKFPSLIEKRTDKEILVCSLRYDDNEIALSISDVDTGEMLEKKSLNRGYDKGVDIDFYSVKIKTVDEVESRIVFTGRNTRQSLKEEIEQNHWILFAYEDD